MSSAIAWSLVIAVHRVMILLSYSLKNWVHASGSPRRSFSSLPWSVCVPCSAGTSLTDPATSDGSSSSAPLTTFMGLHHEELSSTTRALSFEWASQASLQDAELECLAH